MEFVKSQEVVRRLPEGDGTEDLNVVSAVIGRDFVENDIPFLQFPPASDVLDGGPSLFQGQASRRRKFPCSPPALMMAASHSPDSVYSSTSRLSRFGDGLDGLVAAGSGFTNKLELLRTLDQPALDEDVTTRDKFCMGSNSVSAT